ncbi:MAG: molybdopterin-dependent oxidoreductase [Anaerolineae bacterium]|nr:molybdopterin-dependent oxidoreductase [Anaerolineae bacterium]
MHAKTLIENGTIPTICRQCAMGCGINSIIEEGRIVKITGLKVHPQNEGRLCPKGVATIDTVYHPERLLKPLKKMADGSFEEISLDQAMEEITEKLTAVKDRYGARSIGCWQGEGLGFAQQEMYPRRFLHALGSPNFFSANSLCFVSRYIAYQLVQGYWNTCPDFRKARCIVLWGTNPPISHFTFIGPINEALRRGAKLIVIDPLRTEIALKADLHLRPLPGTDGLLAWGLFRYLVENGHYDREFVAEHSVGFDDAASYASDFTSQLVSEKTGLKEEDILACGEMIAQGQPQAVNYVGVSLEHQDNGLNTVRSIACLGGLYGSLDREGGDLWPESLGERTLSLYEEIPLMDQQPIGAEEYPVLYDYYKECHSMTAINAMITGEPYPVRGLIVVGGNPVNSNPNAQKVAKAFSNLDILVVRELFLTETAKLADYVLPAASFIERSELHTFSHYQWVSLSRRVMQIPGVIDEYAFWRDLAHRLGFGEKYFPWETEEHVNRWLLEPTGISLEQLEQVPEGLRYKPVRYAKHKEQPLPTPSGKFEFTSRYLEDFGHPAIPIYEEPYHLRNRSQEFPFLLISGVRKRVFLTSRYRNIARLRKNHDQAEIDIHPADAVKLGIQAGGQVQISSKIGSIILQANIMDDQQILPGLVQITHGWEYESNVNRLTFDEVTDPISGFPLMTSIPVRLERL